MHEIRTKTNYSRTIGGFIELRKNERSKTNGALPSPVFSFVVDNGGRRNTADENCFPLRRSWTWPAKRHGAYRFSLNFRVKIIFFYNKKQSRNQINDERIASCCVNIFVICYTHVKRLGTRDVSYDDITLVGNLASRV